MLAAKGLIQTACVGNAVILVEVHDMAVAEEACPLGLDDGVGSDVNEPIDGVVSQVSIADSNSVFKLPGPIPPFFHLSLACIVLLSIDQIILEYSISSSSEE